MPLGALSRKQRLKDEHYSRLRIHPQHQLPPMTPIKQPVQHNRRILQPFGNSLLGLQPPIANPEISPHSARRPPMTMRESTARITSPPTFSKFTCTPSGVAALSCCLKSADL